MLTDDQIAEGWKEPRGAIPKSATEIMYSTGLRRTKDHTLYWPPSPLYIIAYRTVPHD